MAKICPKCGAETSVVLTRETSDGAVRRRRVCTVCNYSFYTREFAVVQPLPCSKCGARLRKKIAVRGEVVFDHPLNGCEFEQKRVRSYMVAEWNRMVENG